MEHSNKEKAIAYYEMFSNDQLDALLEHHHDDVVANFYAFGQVLNGKEAMIDFIRLFKIGFPDAHFKIHNIIEEGNFVAAEVSFIGTHTGVLQTPMGAIEPTGKSVELVCGDFATWEDGKLKTLHNYQDAGSMMRQLGLM